MPIQAAWHVESMFCGDRIVIEGSGIIRAEFIDFGNVNLTPNDTNKSADYLRELAEMFSAAADYVEKQS